MTTEQKVDLVTDTWEEYGLMPALETVEMPKSSWYYHRKEKVSYAEKYAHLHPALEEIARQHPEYGYRRTTDSQHPYPRYPSLVKELEIAHPDQVWVSNITYIRLYQEYVYLAIITDVFTRSIRGWCISRSLDQELNLMALRAALETHSPEFHHIDQGVQFAAFSYSDLLKLPGVQISMAAVGKAEENGHAERFMHTIK